MKHKKTLVFDFDGTLVNSMEHLCNIASKVLSDFFGITVQEGRRLYRLTSGLPFSEQVATLFPEEKKKTMEAARFFEKKKKESYFLEKSFPDTLETLRYLKEEGYAVIISSNSEQQLIDPFVAQLKIPCDLILGYQKGFAKGLAHFSYILEHRGGRLEEMVFIGDSLKDGEKAFENGIDFIAKEGMFTKEEFRQRFPGIEVIAQLAELKKLF